MLVNGKLWPKADVKPCEYRLRMLNGCDSRYLVIQFVVVDWEETSAEGGELLEYTIIGSDEGLGNPQRTDGPLVVEPGARYDIVIDFSPVPGRRVIFKNLASDAPFGGDYGDANAAEDLYEDRRTDRIMAFNVEASAPEEPKLNTGAFPHYAGVDWRLVSKRRRVALFEGLDEFGRLQPLLGAVDGSDEKGLFPAYTWSQPTTEIVQERTVEEWYIHNFSADAHPIHLHLVNFEIIADFTFTYETDGEQETIMHNGAIGVAPKISSVSKLDIIHRGSEYYGGAPKDSVVVLPGDTDLQQGHGAIVRAYFPKPGRYVWHCHILRYVDLHLVVLLCCCCTLTSASFFG